jgi:hypothetical protein
MPPSAPFTAISNHYFTPIADPLLNKLPHAARTYQTPWPVTTQSLWTLATASIGPSLKLTGSNPAQLNPEMVEDLWILCHYTG